MTLPDVLNALQQLNRADKLRAMQFLVESLVEEENGAPLQTSTFAVWSPYEAYEAAEILNDYLNR